MSINNDSEGPRFTADDMQLLGHVVEKALNGECTPNKALGFALVVLPDRVLETAQIRSNIRPEHLVKVLRDTADNIERDLDTIRTR